MNITTNGNYSLNSLLNYINILQPFFSMYFCMVTFYSVHFKKFLILAYVSSSVSLIIYLKIMYIHFDIHKKAELLVFLLNH